MEEYRAAWVALDERRSRDSMAQRSSSSGYEPNYDPDVGPSNSDSFEDSTTSCRQVESFPESDSSPPFKSGSNTEILQGARDADGGGGSGKKRRRRNKHLYLVLDDWIKGYSIHKIQSDSFDSDSDSDDQHSGAARHLPEPPALRLECPVGPVPHSGMSFSALGTKICFTFMNQRCSLIYDTKTDALQHPTEGWSWKTLPPPPPTFRRRVNSYALHPDGCTIFMTTANFMTTPIKGCLGTYSFNTKDSVWRWHGEWALPYIEEAHFDRELNAWVGLRWDGYISACQVASPSCHSTTPTLQLDCQTTKEKLFCKDRQMHMGASLTYMGTSKFCLVECVKRERVEEGQELGDHDSCVLHITIFGLKYNHKGELRITDHRSTRSFILDCQTTKEKLFCKDRKPHMGASLTYMGTSKFCLVECVKREGVEEGQALGDHDSCVLHITIFGLKYNHKGELRITDHRSTRSFIVSSHKDHFGPVAFWM
uniref:Uncharacterized protein n=1 Tax=Aegilops tauschii TaxID=37682 RepID=M8BNX0_AEGTA